MDARWRIELFGGLRAVNGGSTVCQGGPHVITRFRTLKTELLLAYLACHLGPHRREALIDLLWPEYDPRAGRHNLSNALSSLRDLLEPPFVPGRRAKRGCGAVILADRASAGLSAEAVSTDVAEFETGLQRVMRAQSNSERVQSLIQAVELYRGELLTGYYESWILAERERLAEAYFAALDQLLPLLEGDLHRALEYARQGVRLDPLREEAQRGLIRLLAAVGRPAAAIRQYRELERLLEEELGTRPEPATSALASSLCSNTGQEKIGQHVRVPARATRGEGATTGFARPVAPSLRRVLEPVGGAVPLDSAFYIVRPADQEFRDAIAQQDSIVLVKGARQIGKTSLLARGLQEAREAGARVVLTDFQKLKAAHLAAAEPFFRAMTERIAEQLCPDSPLDEVWHPRRDANANFESYLRREVLGQSAAPIVWGLDEVDRLFTCDFGSEVFGLFRSWHNERALDPAGPWSRLTLAIAYATEAHLFITDVNQSPFNVGTQLVLEDFTFEQVADLNRRYGSPLRDDSGLARFFRLVGGHPFLVRRGLHEMAARGVGLAALEAQADQDAGLFGNHLRRILVLLAQDPALCDVVRGVLQGGGCPNLESFYRLRSAGVLAGESARDVRPRCHLYAAYLGRHLR